MAVNELAKQSTQSLMKVTRDLLQRDKRTQQEIHQGTGIPFHWIQQFSFGKFKNPSVNRVQNLYEFLSGKPLL